MSTHTCDWPQQAAEVATAVALGIRELIEQEQPPGTDQKANEAWIQAGYALAFTHCHDHKTPHDDRSALISAENHVHRLMSWLQIAPPEAETSAMGTPVVPDGYCKRCAPEKITAYTLDTEQHRAWHDEQAGGEQ